jgi:hypothetical protein
MGFSTQDSFKLKKSFLSFLYFALFFAPIIAYSQPRFTLEINSQVTDGKKRLDGAEIILYKNNKEVTKIITDKSGKANFILEPDNEYLIKFTKTGFVSKSLKMDTRNVPDSDIREGTAFGSAPVVELFQEIEGLDVSILNQPAGILVYSKATKNFDYDMNYTKSIQAQVQEMLRELELKQKEEAARLAKFNAAIIRADKAFNAKDYENAKNSYTEASSLKPKETYPKERLSEIAKLQGEEDARKKAEADRLAKEKELNEKYAAAIAKADRALASKDFSGAKGGYNEALNLKPAEQYPKTKLEEIEKLLADEDARKKSDAEKLAKQKEIDEKYNAAIAKADKALGAKDYPNAKLAYNEALGIKASEQYPKTKINEIDKLLAEEEARKKAEADKLAKDKELNEKYNAVITKADNSFGAKDYAAAKSAYNEASGIKPSEQYPKTKIQEIDKLLADEAAKKKTEEDRLAKDKELNEKYNAAIAKADKAFEGKDLAAAKTSYNEALGLKPTEQHPKTRIQEIDKILADDAAQKKAEADRLAKEKELNDKYNAVVAKADKAFDGKEYATAKTTYNEALGLKPTEQHPKTRIQEIDKILADDAAQKKAEADRLAKEKELNDKYNAAVAKADKAFTAKDYSSAKTAYNEALGIKSAEQHPKDRIQEIDKLLAEEDAKKKTEAEKLAKQKEIDDQYKAVIAKADNSFGAKDYAAAKSAYNEASGIKPSEQYPKTKIQEIDKLLADEAAKKKAEEDRLAKDKELNEKYNAAIAKADKAFDGKDLAAAKTSYNEALGLKPTEQHPKTRIQEIDKILADDAAQKKAEADRLAKEKELNDKYNAVVAKADKAFDGKEYATAKTTYNEALGLKPTEQHPKTRIQEIDKILADDAAQKKAEADRLAKEKELNDKYNAAVAKADKAFTAKDYSSAKTAYNEALGIKSAEQHPKDRIQEIDKLLAEEDAKKKTEAEKLAKQKEIDDQYKAVIAKADNSFGAKDYAAAKSAYNEASGIKPSEQYPKTKIQEIDKLLADEAAKKKAEEDRLAKDKELNEKYNAAIAKADKAFDGKDLAAAKTSYNEALGLKPTEQHPKARIQEIDKILADDAAQKKAEADRLAKEKELNDKYNAAVAKADKAFTAKDYSSAKTAYNEALGIKSAEQHPKNRIQEIDKLLAEEDAKKKTEAEKLAKQKEIDDQYKAAIAKADNSFGAKDYAAAKSAYNEASGIKPSEQYPKTKIQEIDKLLADEAAKKKAEEDRLAKDKELNEKYNAAVAKADKAFGAKDYAAAKTAYGEAIGYKANEQYPKTKIQEIEKILADEDARKKAEADRLAKEKSLGERYASAIARADQLFQSKEYNAAKVAYNEALSIKSAEKYPKDRIAEIDKLIAENAIREAAEKEINEKYQAAIGRADKFFSSKDYVSAKGNYSEALKIKPNERYPSDKIAEIDKILADQKVATAKVEPPVKQAAPEVPKGKEEKEKYLNDLARKYPQGITEEIIDDKDQRKTVTRRIVVKGTDAHEYQKIVYSFGTFYTKNGDNITVDTWNKETAK